MTFECKPYARRSIRLKGFDYAQSGAYFVTLVTRDRRPAFGHVEDGQVVLTHVGAMAADEWERTAIARPNVELDAFVVMPNHLHGIVIIQGEVEATNPMSRPAAMAGQPNVGACQRHAPTDAFPSGSFRAPLAGSLGAIINHFKGSVTKKAAELTGGLPLWQRGYYEHVIRDEADLERICQYIADNPSRWDDDVENPTAARS